MRSAAGAGVPPIGAVRLDAAVHGGVSLASMEAKRHTENRAGKERNGVEGAPSRAGESCPWCGTARNACGTSGRDDERRDDDEWGTAHAHIVDGPRESTPTAEEGGAGRGERRRRGIADGRSCWGARLKKAWVRICGPRADQREERGAPPRMAPPRMAPQRQTSRRHASLRSLEIKGRRCSRTPPRQMRSARPQGHARA